MPASFAHHFIAICVFEVELATRNPVTRIKLFCFFAHVTLKFDRHLFYVTSMFVDSHPWIQTGVTSVKFDDDAMTGTLWKMVWQADIDGRTDGWTDRWMDTPTDGLAVWKGPFIELLGCSKKQLNCNVKKKLNLPKAWWWHQMETFSVWLALCARNSPVTSEFPSQRQMTRGFVVFFDLCLKTIE